MSWPPMVTTNGLGLNRSSYRDSNKLFDINLKNQNYNQSYKRTYNPLKM